MVIIDNFTLSLSVGQVEPLYISLSLHNIKTKQKLSEDFYTIPEGTLNLLDVCIHVYSAHSLKNYL
jgi:hypothetical protein